MPRPARGVSGATIITAKLWRWSTSEQEISQEVFRLLKPGGKAAPKYYGSSENA